jgi:hypothetical protein
MANYYLDTNALIDFSYEQDLFWKGYIKPGNGLEHQLADYADYSLDVGKLRQTVENKYDEIAMKFLLGKRDDKGRNEFDYIREIKDFCNIKNIRLLSSYLAYYEFVKHKCFVSAIEEMVGDIPFKLVQRKIVRQYEDLVELTFKYAQSQDRLRFTFHEPLEVAFKWHEAGLGMGVIDKVENEKMDFQDTKLYGFLTPLVDIGFSILDAMHLYLCNINGIRYFVSKDRQFGRYSKFINENLGIIVVNKYKGLLAILIKEEGTLDPNTKGSAT